MRRSTDSLRAIVAGCALVALAARRAGAADGGSPPSSVEFVRDVVYCRAGGAELKLDLARPKIITRPLPCVVVLHGGGWTGGSRAELATVTWLFAGRDFVSASIDYRLAPTHHFPAAVEDVKCAIRYLRRHAQEYQIDPQRIGAAGFSAGGNLAMMLGTTRADDGLEGAGGWPEESSRVQAVVSFFGPTDLAAADVPETTRRIFGSYLGGTAAEQPATYRKASPLTYVRADSAPMLLFQGTADRLVPATQAVHMAEAMTRVGVAGRIELLVGAPHGDWVPAEIKRTTRASFAFFDTYLRPAPPTGRTSTTAPPPSVPQPE